MSTSADFNIGLKAPIPPGQEREALRFVLEMFVEAGSTVARRLQGFLHDTGLPVQEELSATFRALHRFPPGLTEPLVGFEVFVGEWSVRALMRDDTQVAYLQMCPEEDDGKPAVLQMQGSYRTLLSLVATGHSHYPLDLHWTGTLLGTSYEVEKPSFQDVFDALLNKASE